jgi:hypothetical protein
MKKPKKRKILVNIIYKRPVLGNWTIWYFGHLSKPYPKLIQNQNLFSLDRFWTDHMIKKLILVRIMINFGQYLILTKLLIFKKLYKFHINTIFKYINLINYFKVHYISIILLQKPIILYYHNISIFSQY